MKKILLVLVASILVISCSTEAIDNFTIRIKPNIMEHIAMIEIYNANDPSVELTNLNITFEGESIDDLYELSGSKNFKPVDGRIAVGLHPRANPAPGEVVSITAIVTADGYLRRREVIEFGLDGLTQSVIINILEISNPPAGVKFNPTETIGLTSGSLSSTELITVNPGANSSTGMEISLPSGTSFIDRDGNTISGSSLSVDVGHFDSDNAQSMDNFPGGFYVDSVQVGNNTEDGFFVTAGFTTIDMSVDGTEVKEFSQPITVTMDISDNAVNPNTGNTINIGDTIPVWSYDELDGKWSYEVDGVVTDDGAGGKVVQYSTNHLSWYNLDFKGPRCGGGQSTLTFSIPGWPTNYSEYFTLRAVWPDNPSQPVSRFSTKIKRMYDGASFTLRNVPNQDILILVFGGFDRYGTGTPVGSIGPINLCGQSTYPVSLNFAPPQNQVITFSLDAICPSNPNIVMTPNTFPVYYKETGDGGIYSLLGFVENGTGTTNQIQLGRSYDFRGYYDGASVDTTVVVDKLNYEITLALEAVCDI